MLTKDADNGKQEQSDQGCTVCFRKIIVPYSHRMTNFSVAGENITAVAVNESVIEVAWDQPAQLYIDIDNNANSPALAGNL